MASIPWPLIHRALSWRERNQKIYPAGARRGGQRAQAWDGGLSSEGPRLGCHPVSLPVAPDHRFSRQDLLKFSCCALISPLFRCGCARRRESLSPLPGRIFRPEGRSDCNKPSRVTMLPLSLIRSCLMKETSSRSPASGALKFHGVVSMAASTVPFCKAINRVDPTPIARMTTSRPASSP